MTRLPSPLHRPQHLALLHGLSATRQIEQSALRHAPHQGLIEPAGVAAAQLARAIAPHARRVVVVCGPGHNGADGGKGGGNAKRWFLLGTDYVYPRTTNKILRAFLKSKGVAEKDIEDVAHCRGHQAGGLAVSARQISRHAG